MAVCQDHPKLLPLLLAPDVGDYQRKLNEGLVAAVKYNSIDCAEWLISKGSALEGEILITGRTHGDGDAPPRAVFQATRTVGVEHFAKHPGGDLALYLQLVRSEAPLRCVSALCRTTFVSPPCVCIPGR
jgi:hypothetical protein